jgi:hypothetical protein
MLATWGRTIAKCSRAFTIITKQAMPFGDQLSLKSESDFSNILSLNIDWRFCDFLSLKRKRWSLVAFAGLEGVNNVFSHVSLILVATSSIFAKLLRTSSFLALVHRSCAPMSLVQNAWVSHFFSQKSSS